jgi:hypothetical protein
MMSPPSSSLRRWRARLADLLSAIDMRRERLWLQIRRPPLTPRIMATAGDHVPAEIEYLDQAGRVVGFWAYGHWDPAFPYRGDIRLEIKDTIRNKGA